MRILPLPEIYQGPTAMDNLLSFLERHSIQNTMIVTDRGIVKAGIYERIERLIGGSKRKIFLFDEVEPDPSIDIVNRAAAFARESEIDAVIALGGGSPIDTAKIAAVLKTNEGEIEQYIGIDLIKKDGLPVIAVPTTAGTGSEVTPVAILSDEKEHLKKGVVSNRIIPSCAILDPTLTIGMPPHITAYTGIDALTHALEAYTSVNASEYSDALALRACSLITSHIREAFQDPENIESREGMLIGSLFGGISFGNAGVAAVHAFAYPLGGTFHIPHGLANSVMLPIIMEFNMIGNERKFLDLAHAMAGPQALDVTPKSAVDIVNRLSDDLKIPRNLADLGIPEASLEELAESAMKVTRLLANNPKKIELRDAIQLYIEAYER